jgi:hypothetical protein
MMKANIQSLIAIGLASLLSTTSWSGLANGINRDSIQNQDDPGVRFVNIAQSAGLQSKTLFGSEHKNKYLVETTGCGVALFDYDRDGWLDIFVVNGWRLDGFPAGLEPTNHLYRNNGDGTFTDVTAKARLAHSGWGQGVCVGDYDNDGFEDVLVTYWGFNVLYRNNGDGTFTDVTEKAGVAGRRQRWNTGCAFLDYDRDGYLDLFIANYIDFDIKTAPLPETGPCLYKGVQVACGPPGLPGGVNILYHNNGNGTFTDVSEKAGITKTNGTYGLGVLTADFDNDGWADIYVANDSAPACLYHNNKDGTFTDLGIESGCSYSQDGKPQAGMGVSAGDYDHDGWLDIFKTNFADDTANLYRNLGKGLFDDVTFASGIGVNTLWLGWGCGFIDVDNNGWIDILVCNGHVYPEVDQLKSHVGYRQPKVLYRNLENGRFKDISRDVGGPITDLAPSRGCAFGDVDNDGDIDVVVNTVNDVPQLLRCDSPGRNNWIHVRTMGTKSNRSGIGARLTCVTGKLQQIDEVRSGGSYISQSDLRVHFGLGQAAKVDELEIHWPSGQVDVLKDIPVNQTITVKEGAGIVRSDPPGQAIKKDPPPGKAKS